MTVYYLLFLFSGARPQTALPVLKIPEQVVRSQHNEQCQQKEEALFQTDEPDLSSKDQKICDAVSDVRQLLFHSSDVTVLPIFGSSKVCILLRKCFNFVSFYIVYLL